MAKPFYFWQTVSKEAKFGRFGPLKGQMATLFQTHKRIGQTDSVYFLIVKHRK